MQMVRNRVEFMRAVKNLAWPSRVQPVEVSHARAHHEHTYILRNKLIRAYARAHSSQPYPQIVRLIPYVLSKIRRVQLSYPSGWIIFATHKSGGLEHYVNRRSVAGRSDASQVKSSSLWLLPSGSQHQARIRLDAYFTCFVLHYRKVWPTPSLILYVQ